MMTYKMMMMMKMMREMKRKRKWQRYKWAILNHFTQYHQKFPPFPVRENSDIKSIAWLMADIHQALISQFSSLTEFFMEDIQSKTRISEF